MTVRRVVVAVVFCTRGVQVWPSVANGRDGRMTSRASAEPFCSGFTHAHRTCLRVQGEGVKGHPFAGCVTWEMLCSLHSFTVH